MAVTLFPPILAVNLPASSTSVEKFRIKFAFSQFNSKNDISGIQCTIREMSNNSNAFVTEKPAVGNNFAPYGIIQIKNDYIYKDGDFYYIEISKDFINELTNVYYKVQLRFISNKASLEDYRNPDFPSWIARNPGLFSEWSTVGLLRFVIPPVVTMPDLADYKSKILNVSSSINYDNNESDYIEKFRYSLYYGTDTDLKNPIETSNWILSTPDIETLDYEFKTELKNLKNKPSYQLKLEYQTHEDYRLSSGEIPNDTTSFTPKINESTPIEGVEMNYEPNPDTGSMYVKISNIDPAKAKNEDGKSYLDKNNLLNIIIKRTDSKSNFSKWETIQNCIKTLNQTGYLEWNDNTVESGIWYKYGYYVKDPDGNTTNLFTPNINPQMCYIEDMFLTNRKGHLRVRLNQQIDSLKYIVNEQVTTTLGNKYPVIFRSGNTKYRQFNINGTIATEGDKTEYSTDKHTCKTEGTPSFNKCVFEGSPMFLSEEDLNPQKLYTLNSNTLYKEDYIDKYNITSQNNFIFEKALRDKVIDFLYDNSVKLFKTLTEGNILVKLTNISFTPNKTTGRMIYDFSATATEIAEDTIENYDKYDIINIDNTIGHFEYQVLIADKPLTTTATDETEPTTISNYTEDSILVDEEKEIDKASDTDANLNLYYSWVED